MTLTRVLTIVAFGLALGLFATMEILARRPESRVPTFGDVCAVIMRYEVGRLPVGRIAMFGFWWWLGWHFLAR